MSDVVVCVGRHTIHVARRNLAKGHDALCSGLRMRMRCPARDHSNSRGLRATADRDRSVLLAQGTRLSQGRLSENRQKG